MSRNHENTLVIVFTNQAYVTVFNGEIHEEQKLWNSPFTILSEYQNTCSGIYIDLLLDLVKYKDAVKVAVDYIDRQMQETSKLETVLEDEPPIGPVLETEPKIEFLTPKIKKAKITIMDKLDQQVDKTTAKVSAHAKMSTIAIISVLFGTAHFIAQSTADVICFTEAKLISGINAHQEGVKEIMKARRKQTEEYQKIVLNSPAKLKEASAELKASIMAKTGNNNLKTA